MIQGTFEIQEINPSQCDFRFIVTKLDSQATAIERELLDDLTQGILAGMRKLALDHEVNVTLATTGKPELNRTYRLKP